MNLRQLKGLAPYAALLLVAAMAGLATTSWLSARVQVLPGEQGCVRLADFDERADCYGESIGAQVPRVSKTGTIDTPALQAALRDVERRAEGDQNLSGVCHQAMHRVGERDGADVAAARGTVVFPDAPDHLCSAGYAHGVVVGYMSHLGAAANLGSLYGELCVDRKAAAGCAHGMGHTLLQKAGGSETELRSKLNVAIKSCATLPADRPNDCYAGVYMQLSMLRPAVSLKSFAGACEAQATDTLRDYCFYYLPASAASNKLSDASTARACANLSERYAESCAESFGRNLTVDRLGSCTHLSDALAGACFSGAHRLLVSSNVARPAELRKACSALESGQARLCAAQLQSALKAPRAAAPDAA